MWFAQCTLRVARLPLPPLAVVGVAVAVGGVEGSGKGEWRRQGAAVASTATCLVCRACTRRVAGLGGRRALRYAAHTQQLTPLVGVGDGAPAVPGGVVSGAGAFVRLVVCAGPMR